eukprot:5068223-Heterocapsa_arctica.AAC.1
MMHTHASSRMAGSSGRVQKTSSEMLGLSSFIVIPLGKRCEGRCPCCSTTKKIEQWRSKGGSTKVHPIHAALVVVQDLVSECRRFNEGIAPHVASQEGFQQVCQHRGR